MPTADTEAAGPAIARTSHAVHLGAVVTVDDLFPRAATALAPFEVAVEEIFDTVTMPRRAALDVISRLARIRPHPVGAAVSRALTDEWVLNLPPGSAYGMEWSWPAVHREEGFIAVPPHTAEPDDDLHWARVGNDEGRVFSAPIPDRTPVRT